MAVKCGIFTCVSWCSIRWSTIQPIIGKERRCAFVGDYNICNGLTRAPTPLQYHVFGLAPGRCCSAACARVRCLPRGALWSSSSRHHTMRARCCLVGVWVSRSTEEATLRVRGRALAPRRSNFGTKDTTRSRRCLDSSHRRSRSLWQFVRRNSTRAVSARCGAIQARSVPHQIHASHISHHRIDANRIAMRA